MDAFTFAVQGKPDRDGKGGLRMNYFKHLCMNWKVAFHALTDFFAHFIHGLIPCIKIKHHQPVNIKKEVRDKK